VKEKRAAVAGPSEVIELSDDDEEITEKEILMRMWAEVSGLREDLVKVLERIEEQQQEFLLALFGAVRGPEYRDLPLWQDAEYESEGSESGDSIYEPDAETRAELAEEAKELAAERAEGVDIHAGLLVPEDWEDPRLDVGGEVGNVGEDVVMEGNGQE
jgi:hypothetical protein